MLSWSLFVYLSEWVIRLGMLVVVTKKRREPTGDMAWLAVIFFQPYLGFVAYLLFGENRVSKGRMTRRRELVRMLDSRVAHPATTRVGCDPAPLDEGQRVVAKLAAKLGGMPLTEGNDGHLMPTTNEVIDSLVADIEAATDHIHLEFYIWGVDATSARIERALAAARQRGVDCRVLVDAVGSAPMLRARAPAMRRAGIEVVAMLPVGVLRSWVARIDMRNHRKIAVIDGRIGYTGSQNIVDADYGKGGLVWHDLMMRIEGPAVIELQTIFVSDWFLETGALLDGGTLFPPTEPRGQLFMQTLPSGPAYTTENYQRMILHALHTAREEVVITTPYFIPDEAFLQALEVAVLRDVDVLLLLPEKSDQLLVGNASRAYYEELLDMGVRISLYQPGLLHAKTMRVDRSVAFFGTSNFDIRSFQLNEELTIVLYGATAVNAIDRQQREYLKDSRPLPASEWATRPFHTQLVQNITKLFSPLL